MRAQDVYSGIAALVRERVEREAGEGRAEARALVGNIDRKLVKQTVMTSVYGVTFVGARSQIGARLRDRGWENDSIIFRTSSYGARVRAPPQPLLGCRIQRANSRMILAIIHFPGNNHLLALYSPHLLAPSVTHPRLALAAHPCLAIPTSMTVLASFSRMGLRRSLVTKRLRRCTRTSQITLDALGTMFSKAKDVMNWLTACARVIATSGEPVSWHTPLGLPIVQPYRRKARAPA